MIGPPSASTCSQRHLLPAHAWSRTTDEEVRYPLHHKTYRRDTRTVNRVVAKPFLRRACELLAATSR
eukprot:1859451-Amphidinium_carterae.1